MATARDFIKRVSQVDGVAGCLLINRKGTLLGHNQEDIDMYTALMQVGGNQAREIMETMGFSHCRHLSFRRRNNTAFHVFPIAQYMLGVVQNEECYVPDMLEEIYSLVDRVSTGTGAG